MKPLPQFSTFSHGFMFLFHSLAVTTEIPQKDVDCDMISCNDERIKQKDTNLSEILSSDDKNCEISDNNESKFRC